MWQRGHQIGWQFRWVTKKSDSIVTKNCDKFGDSKNMSPTLSPDWSQNTVNHQIGHQICHKICHQTPWGSYMPKAWLSTNACTEVCYYDSVKVNIPVEKSSMLVKAVIYH